MDVEASSDGEDGSGEDDGDRSVIKFYLLRKRTSDGSQMVALSICPPLDSIRFCGGSQLDKGNEYKKLLEYKLYSLVREFLWY